MFEKVLIANRGEIALRVIRALEELAVATVAVYSELDRDALHVARAGEAYNLGERPAGRELPEHREDHRASRSARAPRRSTPATASSPRTRVRGARARRRASCSSARPPSAIEAMGSKTRARELMKAAGVPIVPGTTEPVAELEDAQQIASDEHRLPGRRQGGRRRRRQGLPRGARRGGAARTPSRAPRAKARSSSPTPRSTSSATCPDPRHVEVQVLADRHGNVIHLGERDCSIQRRHQKLIEESPAPEWIVSEELRARIGAIGVEAARAVDYVGAGTVEGLLQGRGEYFFLEMNTRVQVEHCVTEMTTGIDIVKEGIRAAAGEPLGYSQDDVALRGHAIECRINAEDASQEFAPTPGRITHYREPAGPGRAHRLRRRRGRRDLADVRPDGREADRLGRRSRAGRPRACCGRCANTRSAG